MRAWKRFALVTAIVFGGTLALLSTLYLLSNRNAGDAPFFYTTR